ncbi:MAG: FlgT protein [Thermodesulfobacteriota bacterium]|nr:FlgT protein [Thermodesulfobacteriota bacterium]
MFRKKCFLMIILFCAGLFVPFASALAAEGGLRYSIMVSKFENRSNWSGQWDLGDAWGAVLTDSLTQTGRFIVLGEKDMRQEAMEEQDLAASGRAAGGGKTVVTGQMTPAQLLIKGDITHFADATEGGGGGIGFAGFRLGAGTSTAEINTVLYIVDSSTGQVLASKKCYGKVSDTGLSVGVSRHGFSGDVGGFRKTNAGKAVEQAVDEAVGFLMGKLSDIPWTGDVILVKGDRVYINRGSREGVSAGQTFQVGKAEVLRDPKTGEVLDQSMEKVGMIEVVTVKEKISICKVAQGSGIAKGMTVMRQE